MNIQLGPFQLLEPIGKGGMGVVWLAQHEDTHVQVAVKVITQRVSRDEKTLQAFKNEVRAVAALQHPGIVWVVEYGEVDEEASRASERRLVTGSPYLVMEMASGGTLMKYSKGMPYRRLKVVLLNLLDALAHAHARGVIHRDLKPGNILICGPEDLRPGLKLTDFGIAHAREETVSHSMSNHVIGTLHYMAPEQIRADWRDYGPWTDLYALGTIAYRLASGRLPFKGKRGASLMVAQMNHRPPPLDPVYPVPDGFEDWLLTMMRKEHWRRFQCAADAALALEALDDPPLPSVDLPSDSLGSIPLATHEMLEDSPTTLVLESTLELAESVEATDTVGHAMASPTMSVQGARQRGELDRLRPPLPDTWHRQHAVPSERLRGAGLGLWGLRSLPLVGRKAERDQLWRSLKRVAESRQAGVVILKGPKGVGKSVLAQWLCERAVEIGAAHRFHCSYGPDEALDEGVIRMLRRYFRVARLDDEQRHQRILEVCDSFGETDANQATRVEKLLHPVDPDASIHGGRHNTLRWFFARVASDRPLIYWVDDAQYAMDAVKLVGSVLRSQKTNPIRMLTLLTVDPDELSRRPLEAAFIDQLTKLDRTEVIELDALSDEQIMELAHVHMGLERSLAEAVTDRAKGIPQYAVQVVGDWVDKNALQRSPNGLVLRQDQALPSTMSEVWSERLDSLLEELPPMASQLLERAAVLGLEVRMHEWVEVCDHSDSSPGRERDDYGIWRSVLVDRMLGLNLAEEREGGFAFVNEDLRATLLERARKNGRFVNHNRAVARMLQRRPEPPAERLGVHLVAARELNAAVEALLGGIRSRVASVGPRAAMPLVELLEKVLQDANVPENDSTWGRLWLVQADLATQRGRLSPALEMARKVETASKQHGWVGLLAMAVFTQGRVAMLRGQHDVAERLFARFEVEAVARAHALHRAAARHVRSLSQSDPAKARSHAAAAMEWLDQTEATMVDIWRVLGVRTLLATRAIELVRHLTELDDIYASRRKAAGLAEAWTMLAAALRRKKQGDEAVGALEQAVRLYRKAESDEAPRAQIQLAILRLGRGEIEPALTLCTEVAEEVAREGHRKPMALRAEAAVAACEASLGRLDKIGKRLADMQVLASETGLSEREVAWCLAKVGEESRRFDRIDLAIFAWELGWDQYRALGDEGQARRLHTLISRFEGRGVAG